MDFPMRINKYLAHKGVSTRRGADALIESGKVRINNRRAVLGDVVHETDTVVVSQKNAPAYEYVLYHKPVEVITHSPSRGEKDVRLASGLSHLFPIGRLDKASSGLIILTNDGRITDRVLNPMHEHEKEYEVTVREVLPSFAKKAWERGVDIGGYTTKPARVRIINEHQFSIVLSEGKKHQVRRMCEALHLTVQKLKRTRIMHFTLALLKPGAHRPLHAKERAQFLHTLGLPDNATDAVAPQTMQKSMPTCPVSRPKKSLPRAKRVAR